MPERAYENYISSHLGKVQGEDFDLMERYFRKNYLHHLGAKGSRILEIGCGRGNFLYFLKKNGFADYTGIDLSPECIEFCRSRGLGEEGRLVAADAFDFLSSRKGEFDAVVMNDVLEHIRKEVIFDFMDAMRSALSPGGKLILKTINASNPVTGASSRYYDITHELSFTEESLSQLLTIAGFGSIRVLPQDIWVFNPLVNALGKSCHFLLNGSMRFLFRLYGRRTTRIFTKDLIAVAVR